MTKAIAHIIAHRSSESTVGAARSEGRLCADHVDRKAQKEKYSYYRQRLAVACVVEYIVISAPKPDGRYDKRGEKFIPSPKKVEKSWMKRLLQKLLHFMPLTQKHKVNIAASLNLTA